MNTSYIRNVNKTSSNFAVSCLRKSPTGPPSLHNDSSLHPSFSNNSKATAVPHIKRFSRNLFAQGN